MLKELSREQQLILLGIIAVIASGLLVMFLRYFYPAVFNATKLEERISLPASSSLASTEALLVHISGAVKKEGVFLLQYGDRVFDAIKLAGGVEEDADISSLNLAAHLKDGDKLFIPVKPTFTAAISDNRLSGKAGKKHTAKINLNTANEQELQGVPGVGPVTAQKIIDYRTTYGPFSQIEDVMKTKGIGKGKFEKMKDFIVI
jgi:competence protein ComEA